MAKKQEVKKNLLTEADHEELKELQPGYKSGFLDCLSGCINTVRTTGNEDAWKMNQPAIECIKRMLAKMRALEDVFYDAEVKE